MQVLPQLKHLDLEITNMLILQLVKKQRLLLYSIALQQKM